MEVPLEASQPLVGFALAQAAHEFCCDADPDAEGLPVATIEEGVTSRGLTIGGANTRSTLNSGLNHSQDLFKRVRPGVWRWIEPTHDRHVGTSGAALAEEAYRIAIRNDPDQEGVHYGRVLELLLKEGTVIHGGNPGQTVFSAMNSADQLFDWIPPGKFKWK